MIKALNQLGRFVRRNGDYKKSEEFFHEAIEFGDSLLLSFSDDVEHRVGNLAEFRASSRSGLATTFIRQKRLVEAVPLLQTTLGLLKDLHDEDPSRFSRFSRLIKRNAQLCETLVHLGRNADAEQRYRELEVILKNKEKTFGAQRIAAYMVMYIKNLRDRGLSEMAIRMAKEGDNLGPESTNYWFVLGGAYYRNEQYEAAKDALSRAVELSFRSNNGAAMFLGMTYWRLGNREQAREVFYNATRISIDVDSALTQEAIELLAVNMETVDQNTERILDGNDEP